MSVKEVAYCIFVSIKNRMRGIICDV